MDNEQHSLEQAIHRAEGVLSWARTSIKREDWDSVDAYLEEAVSTCGVAIRKAKIARAVAGATTVSAVLGEDGNDHEQA